MKPKYKGILSTAAVVALFVLSIDGASAQKDLSVENGSIPKAIVGYQGTLLIESHSKDYNKYATKHFTENYKSKFLVVKPEEFITTYSDKNEYRFAILRKDKSETMGNTTTSGSPYTQKDVLEYCIVDRQNGQEICPFATNAYGRVLKLLSLALERERTKQ